MRNIAAPTTSMELADTFGFGAYYYSMETDKRLLFRNRPLRC